MIMATMKQAWHLEELLLLLLLMLMMMIILLMMLAHQPRPLLTCAYLLLPQCHQIFQNTLRTLNACRKLTHIMLQMLHMLTGDFPQAAIGKIQLCVQSAADEP